MAHYSADCEDYGACICDQFIEPKPIEYCNTGWEHPTKFGTLHHFCQLEKGHASEHGCIVCERAGMTFDYDGVKFISEVPC